MGPLLKQGGFLFVVSLLLNLSCGRRESSSHPDVADTQALYVQTVQAEGELKRVGIEFVWTNPGTDAENFIVNEDFVSHDSQIVFSGVGNSSTYEKITLLRNFIAVASQYNLQLMNCDTNKLEPMKNPDIRRWSRKITSAMAYAERLKREEHLNTNKQVVPFGTSNAVPGPVQLPPPQSPPTVGGPQPTISNRPNNMLPEPFPTNEPMQAPDMNANGSYPFLPQ